MQFDVFDAVIMMMNMVKCSELRDYWREGSFTYNTGIAELFTYDRFCALLRNLHFANNTMREDGGDQPTAAEKEANPKLRNWKVAKVRRWHHSYTSTVHLLSCSALVHVTGRAIAQRGMESCGALHSAHGC